MASLPEKNTADNPDEGLPIPQRYFALAAVLGAMTLVVLDGAIANVALPTIADALQVSPAASVWVVTGYQLALVVAILPSAALGESLGYRRVFIGGVVLFTAASVLCALSPSLPWLVFARFLQGLGGAALMSQRGLASFHLSASVARRRHWLELADDCAIRRRRTDSRSDNYLHCELALALRRQPVCWGDRAAGEQGVAAPAGQFASA